MPGQHANPPERNSWWPRNADGSLKEIPGCQAVPYPADGGLKEQVRPFEDTMAMNEIVEKMRIEKVEIDMDAAAEEERRLRMDSSDVPLRPVSQNYIDQVTPEHIRRRLQAQDPAHDQGAFDAPPDRVWFDTSHKDETIKVNGEVVGKITDISLNLDGRPELEATFPIVDVVEVDGECRVVFTNQALYDRMMGYDPALIRELKWAFHNLIAHPLSEITHWLGYLHPKIRAAGLWLHDISVPKHAPNTGRG